MTRCRWKVCDHYPHDMDTAWPDLEQHSAHPRTRTPPCMTASQRMTKTVISAEPRTAPHPEFKGSVLQSISRWKSVRWQELTLDDAMDQRPFLRCATAALLGLWMACDPMRAQTMETTASANLARIKENYTATSARVAKHHAAEAMFLDNDPGSPALLAEQWSLAGSWVAAWLNAHQNATADEVRHALIELAPRQKPDVLALDPTSFLVRSPGEFSNFFIVTRSVGRYRVAWNTADPQPVRGKQAELLAAWHAQSAIDQARDVPTAGPVEAESRILPSDADGHPRFYIDGTYTEPAGMVVPAQTSVWLWDGARAQLLWIDRYSVDIEQPVGTRIEGGLFKIRQVGNFRHDRITHSARSSPVAIAVQGKGVRFIWPAPASKASANQINLTPLPHSTSLLIIAGDCGNALQD